MKKLIAFAAAAVAALSVATADIDLTVGARGIFGIGVGSTLGRDKDTNLDFGKSLDFGGAIFAKVPLYQNLGVQAEVGFTYNSYGIKTKNDGETTKRSFSYKAIDIPLLVAYDIKVNDDLTVTPLFGPKFSIPLGKATLKSEGSDVDVGIDNTILLSVVTGVSVAYRCGPGAIVGDLRYNNGVSHFLPKESDMGKIGDNEAFGGNVARNLQLSVGYQMTLPL